MEPTQQSQGDMELESTPPHPTQPRKFSEALRGCQASAVPELGFCFQELCLGKFEKCVLGNADTHINGMLDHALTGTRASPAASPAAPMALLNGEQMSHNSHSIPVVISRVSQRKQRTFVCSQRLHGHLFQAPIVSVKQPRTWNLFPLS
jgi:hypothetical protein